MKNINQSTRYTEAKNTLDALSAAFNAATAEESRLLGLLAAPADTFDPLAAGLRLLRGEPAQRNDSTGLNRELAQVRERLDTLRPAIEAQRAAVATLVGHGHRVLVTALQDIDRRDLAALTGTTRPALGRHGFRLGRDGLPRE